MSHAETAKIEDLTIFISHSTVDDEAVRRLRQALEVMGHRVIEDSTDFRHSENLPTQIREFIDKSNRVLVLVGEESADSAWVQREIEYAQKCKETRPELLIIPLLLPGGDIDHLHQVYHRSDAPGRTIPLEECQSESFAIKVDGEPGAPHINHVISQVERRLHGGNYNPEIAEVEEKKDFAELILELQDPFIDEDNSASVFARLAFYPPGEETPSITGEVFPYTVPLGKIEAEDIRFYLERFIITPFGPFNDRKERIENQFEEFGLRLFESLRPDDHPEVISAWEQYAHHPRRFTIQAPKATRDPKSKRNPQNHFSITEILSLPWELLHDGMAYLFDDGRGARVRRYLPGARALTQNDETKKHLLRPPLRVLIVCSRPEAKGVGYIDHRVSVRPLVEALESLGDLAEWQILSPATLPNLKATLQAAMTADRPFHIVHFDGHGVYDKHGGLGHLVFEEDDDDKTFRRNEHLVDALKLGKEIANQGVQLFFLEACQSAQADAEVDSSVAGRLLQSGIPSVAAMSHSVLVETARQFTAVFYPNLVKGRRVGSAMLEGQRALSQNRRRGYRWEPNEEDRSQPAKKLPLELDDWFVPILFQHRDDPAVISEAAPTAKVIEELAAHRERYLGEVPKRPGHSFVGRSRELLAAERLLIEQDKPWILFRGEGGEGKTTIAAELARWLVQSRRKLFPRAAFVSVETVNELTVILSRWGEQLLPKQFNMRASTIEEKIELLIQILNDQPAILILDNLESILPPPLQETDEALDAVRDEQWALLPQIQRVLAQCPGTKLILTSRELLPEKSGYRNPEQTLEIGRLSIAEGMDLVARVLAESAQLDPEAVAIEREEEIEHLVELVKGHARALVLLTPELAERGLKATGEELAEIMREMESREGAGRETSLLASMELSLRKLPEEMREALLPLGVMQGGGSWIAIANVLGVDAKIVLPFVSGLVSTGLADLIPLKLPYLRFDPALAPALLHELQAIDPDAETAARKRWMEAYRQLAGFLYEQQHNDGDIQLAYDMTRLELPNLLAALECFAADPENSREEVIPFCSHLETPLEKLSLPAALGQVVKIREQAAKEIENAPWSRASYLALDAAIDQSIARRNLGKALQLSHDLVAKTENAGPDAYPRADYDMAMATFTLGRSQRLAGQLQPALQVLETAQQAFQAIVDCRQSKSAAGMVSACFTEIGDCLAALGELDAAAAKYQAGIDLSRKRDAKRDLATIVNQLATCRLQQKNYAEALQLYNEARQLFDALGERESIAVIWHQIGIVHERTGDFEAAEQAYQASLKIIIDRTDAEGEASTRDQLGILYSKMDRLEDAVIFHQRAAEILSEMGLLLEEGRSRSNLAIRLIKLGRHDDARVELKRAIECKSQFGTNAEPWKTWQILADLETETGNAAAAAEAHLRAIHLYADARRGGWQITQGAGAQFCEMAFQVLTQQPEDIPQLKSQLAELASDSEIPAHSKALCANLIRLLDGERDVSLWQDPALFYMDAAEILLLLEKLERGNEAAPQLSPAVFQNLAAENNIDLASMAIEEKVSFVVSVIAQISGQDPRELPEEQLGELIKAATPIAEQL